MNVWVLSTKRFGQAKHKTKNNNKNKTYEVKKQRIIIKIKHKK